MKTLGRNDPCPCGSGKKHKHCCLQKEETQATSDWSGAIPKAFRWLRQKYPEALPEALAEGFFGSLTKQDYNRLQTHESFGGMMVNAFEWLLAEGAIPVKGRKFRVSELLLGRGGPFFSAEQRQWVEGLAATPLGLYEVVEVTPAESMALSDVLFLERQPVLVREKTASQRLVKFDLIAARIVPMADHFVLSGALYSIPRERGLELIAALRKELKGLALDSPEAKARLSATISNCWLKLFLIPFRMPVMVDQTTGELMVWITDQYRVQDWAALEQGLSREADVEGSRDEGWNRVFTGKDGLQRRSAAINPGEQSDRIEVVYRTQNYADRGRPWFEGVAGRTVEFVSREISDPENMASKDPAGEVSPSSSRVQLPAPEVMSEAIKKRIHQLYADWADQPLAALDNRTPREAMKTPEGLEGVKYLLHTYEQSEARQSKDQRRRPVSHDFLWRALGITP